MIEVGKSTQTWIPPIEVIESPESKRTVAQETRLMKKFFLEAGD